MNQPTMHRRVGLLVLAAVAALGNLARAATTQDIEPARIGLGEAARLTIAATGSDAASITPPMVEGLEFVAVGQSQRTESLNGVSHSTVSITYEVIPQRVGVFTIPSETPSGAPLVLTVNDANGGAPSSSNSPAGTMPRSSVRAPGAAATAAGADGNAFVRLRFAKHDLYVGETIPVDVQVATRDGVVASLNGQPTLNGDSFTLDKLSLQPERTAEVIDGKPFTVFTWHSVLAAVKPGDLSLTMETPLTVRLRAPARPDSGFFGDTEVDDLFNDPSLQSFFGTSIEKEVTAVSPPARFTVQALPTEGRPADFTGAVGKFSISSDVSDEKAAAGDPITLRLHVSGTGNFARVSSSMLHDAAHWKTYAPTATFKAEDSVGYRGEKTFDQPVIATQAGSQSLPALTFSWFDPSTRRYVEGHTTPLPVAILPMSTARAAPLSAAAQPGPPAADNGFRPDHALAGVTVHSLTPLYFRAPYVAAPSIMALAFLCLGFWTRRDRHAEATRAVREGDAALHTATLLEQMTEAASSGNAELFFVSGRKAVQRALASRWQIPAVEITLEEVKARLGPANDVYRLFELADEARYSTVRLTALDVKRWNQVVSQQINGEMTS